MINTRDIELHLSSSRATLELGEPWEILLTITNHSDKPIWLTNLCTSLTLPAEVIHPAESDVGSRGAQCPTAAGSGYDSLVVAPKAAYMCTWRLNEDFKDLNKKADFFEIVFWHVFFHPGKYNLQATIQIWDERPDIEKLSAPRHLATPMEEKIAFASLADSATDADKLRVVGDHAVKLNAEKIIKKRLQSDELARSTSLVVSGQVEVGIKSSYAFSAAAFGGFLAFLFRELYWIQHDPLKITWADVFLLPIYILTSVLISLVVSRISEAKFPLTIKIMDFWGITAFGVLSAFMGTALLNKIIGTIP